jgi:hypothetical protein
MLLPLVIFYVSTAYAAVAGHPQRNISWIDCSKNVPLVPGDTTFDPSTVDLNNLPTTLHCGQIEVPMDYSRPISPSNNITVGLAMYRPEKPKGALFL